MEIIALYPGQGSQQRTMGLSFYESSAQVRALFGLASEIAKRDMHSLLAEGSDRDLTLYAQLAITLVNRSASLRLRELGWRFAAHSGFSLGELSAYAASGILDDETLFQIIVQRMTLMDEMSAKAHSRYGDLAMAAAIGVGYETIAEVLRGESIEELWPSNDNAPLQVVLSGTQAALERARRPLSLAGVRRLIPLAVSGPFHTPLMREATTPFALYLDSLPFKEPKEVVYSSTNAAVVQTSLQARANLASQLAQPVRWKETMHALNGLDIIFAEVGNGTVLSGLCKSNNTNKACMALGDEQAIERALKDTP